MADILEAATPEGQEVLDLERRILDDVAGGWLADLDAIRLALAMGDGDVRRRVLALRAPSLDGALLFALPDAMRLGITHGLEQTEEPEAPVIKGAKAKVPKRITKTIKLDDGAKEALSIARALATAGATDIEIAAPILAHANSVRATVTSTVNAAANEGVLTVARETGELLVWVAERDACVHCLGMSGQSRAAGEAFRQSSRYIERDLPTGPLGGASPPLHPHCRCTLEILGHESYADALRREADRSVLRGFSLSSESNGVRINATKRLLAQPDLVAPKSVKTYAERAVNAGQYPRGRSVPSGS